MFDIAPSEFLLVAFVALVVIGPKDLPKAMRIVGYWVGRARAVGRQFRAGFDEMVREAELAEMEKKWKEENERIMREHPAVRAEPEALPAPAPDHPASETIAPTAGDDLAEAASPEPSFDDEQAPAIVEKPHIEPAIRPQMIEPTQPAELSETERRRKPSQSDLFASPDAAAEKKAAS